MKSVIGILLLTASFQAMALDLDRNDGPQIEPGPPVALGADSAAVVDVLLLAKAKDLTTFKKAGNETTSVSFRNLSPEFQTYTFVRKYCADGLNTARVCLGGAVLTVNLTSKKQGEITTVTATSSVLHMR